MPDTIQTGRDDSGEFESHLRAFVVVKCGVTDFTVPSKGGIQGRQDTVAKGGSQRSTPCWYRWVAWMAHGMKMIRLQITDSISRWLSIQDARIGFHICIVGYYIRIPVLPLCEARLMIRLFLYYLPYTALRKACQRCCKQGLIITPEITHYASEKV